jgi:hypothetical protein
MRRVLVIAVALTITASLALATVSRAASPTLGPLSATDIQGTSAVLVGSVDPEGEQTSYRFQYSRDASFSGAISTPVAVGGEGTNPRQARAAISGLVPETTYHFRLIATNASGTGQSDGGDSFATTQGFGFLAGEEGFSAHAYADGGGPAIRASSHPYQLDLDLGLREGGEFEGQPGVPFPDGDLRDLRVELPPGFLFNPSALDKCSLLDFASPRSSPFEASLSGESCPDRTQVGTIALESSLGGGQVRRFGLFNLQPGPGVAATLGAAPYGVPLVLSADISPDPSGAYVLTLGAANLPQSLSISAMKISLWGTPWAASHNPERGNCLNEAKPGFPWAKCSVGEPKDNKPLAFLTLPGGCGDPLSFSATADSWQQQGTASATATNLDEAGHPAPLGGCNSFTFAPVANGFLTDTKASSPSGYQFRLAVDNSGFTDPQRLAPPQTRQAVVFLPEGVTVNPSVGAGLISCSPAQLAAETAFSPQGAGCPNGSKIGDFRLRSPLFEEWIEGAVYLATPRENPFGTLVAVYLVAKLPQRGILVDVSGRIDPDPATGTIVATFPDLPQLPYTDLELNFRTGQRAFLVTPPHCGPATTRIDLTPYSGPGALHSTTASAIQTGIDGGPCPPAGAPPFAPGVVAGGVNANVNSYTPYFVHLTRRDTEQEITSYSLILPKGITGKLAGIPFCPAQDIEAARQARGRAEEEDPSCPTASMVGHTLSGYGVGSALTYATGRIYLAGPYHGAPLSLVTINSATVGPFDLGTIVIRSAFQIDPRTAQLRIDSSASDPIPHIIEGIPLHLREVRVYLDRPEFTHNPSSCEASALTSTLTGSGARFDDRSDDSSATVGEHFQLLNCLTLGFQPKLGLRLGGGTKRGAFPQLRATFAARGPGDSNLKDIGIVIPHQMFLAQQHIRGICQVPQFESERCPPDSVYGHAVADTPLLDDPLRGNVYLRTHPGATLPDLVADLHSGAIRIVVEGRIGPGPGGGVRTRFTDLPDQPIERFTMTLYGGKRGLLTNSADICAAPPVVSVKALAQNDIGSVFTSVLRGRCGKGQRTHRHGRGGRG